MPFVSSLISELAQQNVTLIAVSKGRTVNQILSLYEQGVRDFGENRIDEALSKMKLLPKEIRWHFIGNLQRKKVPKIVGLFHLIHSVDSYELAVKLSTLDVPQSILLQANTSGEESKSGLTPDKWEECFQQVCELPNLKVEGLMTMAPRTSDERVIHNCFRGLKQLQQRLQTTACPLSMLSMGMSSDYRIAIEEGATHVRLGSALFDVEAI